MTMLTPEAGLRIANALAANGLPAVPSDDLPRLIFEAIGEASMCWNPPPGSQVFATERATAVAEKLIADVRALQPPTADALAMELADSVKECGYVVELLRWAHTKLLYRAFDNMDDALQLDRIKLYLEHGIPG